MEDASGTVMYVRFLHWEWCEVTVDLVRFGETCTLWTRTLHEKAAVDDISSFLCTCRPNPLQQHRSESHQLEREIYDRVAYPPIINCSLHDKYEISLALVFQIQFSREKKRALEHRKLSEILNAVFKAIFPHTPRGHMLCIIFPFPRASQQFSQRLMIDFPHLEFTLKKT